jgi:uncharacterized protein YbjT (DUF2867 family)
MFAVTGATGGIGGRVAARLAERGCRLRLVVRDAARAPDLGAEVAEATHGDADAMRRAVAGADTLFLVSAAESRERVREHLTAVDAAVAAGVERIVYLSFMGAAPDAVFTFARDHAATEERIRASGVAFTVLRDCMYAEYAPLMCGADGVIRGPAGSGRVAWVARDDVADVAVAVLADGGHAGSTYDVTGPEALTMAGTAEVLAGVAGREVAYVEETLEEARESRRPSGHPDWEIEGWVTSYAAIAAGDLARVSDTVERIAGHPPRPLERLLREQPDTWAHLR